MALVFLRARLPADVALKPPALIPLIKLALVIPVLFVATDWALEDVDVVVTEDFTVAKRDNGDRVFPRDDPKS